MCDSVLKSLLDAGQLDSGQSLFLTSNPTVEATVNGDGCLGLDGNTYPSLAEATALYINLPDNNQALSQWYLVNNGLKASISELAEPLKQRIPAGTPLYSDSYPLVPYLIECPNGLPGNIILSVCPGIRDRGRGGEFWLRDLKVDLAQVSSWNVSAALNLLEPQEAYGVGIHDIDGLLDSLKIDHYLIPIPRGQAPHGALSELLTASIAHISELLIEGQNIVIFCDTDMGRAGMVAAKILSTLGVSPRKAVSRVRKAFPNAIESMEQENFVLGAYAGP